MISLTNIEIKIYLEVWFRYKIHSEHCGSLYRKVKNMKKVHELQKIMKNLYII